MSVDGPPITADRVMIRRLWPILLAAALGLVPFTLFSTLVVDLAADAKVSGEVLGGFRGLGGIAALAVGALAAPMLDRLSRRALVTGALAALAAGCTLALLGSSVTWVVFCLIIGGATAVLNPALAALAADTWTDDATSGRAATLVSATTTLTAVLSGPLFIWPSALWGWRVTVVLTVLTCLVVIVLLRRWPHDGGAQGNSATSYLTAYRQAARIPGAVALLGISTLRTTVFMGQLAYVSLWYSERFGWQSAEFAWAWTCSGVAFFLGNYVAGRQLARSTGAQVLLRVIAAAASVAAVAQVVLFTADTPAVALAATAVIAAGHAVVAAAVTSLLVRRSGPRRGTVLALNGVGQSVGVFTGAAVTALALTLGGWPAAGLTLGLVMASCLPLALVAGRTA